MAALQNLQLPAGYVLAKSGRRNEPEEVLSQALDEPGLELPHPRFRQRFFVLGPLAELAPDLRDPVTGLAVADLLRALLRDEAR